MPRGIKRDRNDVKEMVQTLEPYLTQGVSLKKACQYCEIPYTSILMYMEEDEIIRTKIRSLESNLQVLAEQKLYAAINKDDINSTKWLLERIDKEKYSTKQTVDQTTKHIELDSIEEERLDDVLKELE